MINRIHRLTKPGGGNWKIETSLRRGRNCLLFDTGNPKYVLYTDNKKFVLEKKKDLLYYENTKVAEIGTERYNFLFRESGYYHPGLIYTIYLISWYDFRELIDDY